LSGAFQKLRPKKNDYLVGLFFVKFLRYNKEWKRD